MMDAKRAKSALASEETVDGKVLVQLTSEEGVKAGPPLELPAGVSLDQLQLLTNTLLRELKGEGADDEATPYAFFVNEEEVVELLADVVKRQGLETEAVVPVVYQPQAVFRVRAISQCSATIPGHADNIVDAYFSPDGRNLATGSGDKTVRLWDVWTLTPKITCKGHGHWVQCIAWSPDGKLVASGGRDNTVRVWEADKGNAHCQPLTGHRNYITWLSWEPLHSTSGRCTRLASASKDGTVRVWDVVRSRMVFALSQHTKGVTCVKWGGSGLIYTSAQDTTIKVWRAADGALCRTLAGHAHWVNSIALNVDHALRTGAFDERGQSPQGAEAVVAAKEKYDKACGGTEERLVSASEDNTLHLWDPVTSKKPLLRMTGHQKGILYVNYSPDGRLIVSCSLDKSAKLWDGRTGKFIGTFRAHVGPVFRATWSPDSRMLITASEDSTIKLWNVKTQKLTKDLPGHEGSVFAVDWAPNGEMVASGGADKALKIWRH